MDKKIGPISLKIPSFTVNLDFVEIVIFLPKLSRIMWSLQSFAGTLTAVLLWNFQIFTVMVNSWNTARN